MMLKILFSVTRTKWNSDCFRTLRLGNMMKWKRRDFFIALCAIQFIYPNSSYPFSLVTDAVYLALSYPSKHVIHVCYACNFSRSFGSEWIFWNQNNMFFRNMSTQNLPVTSTYHFCTSKYKKKKSLFIQRLNISVGKEENIFKCVSSHRTMYHL